MTPTQSLAAALKGSDDPLMQTAADVLEIQDSALASIAGAWTGNGLPVLARCGRERAAERIGRE